MAPPRCDPQIVLHHSGVPEWGTPSESAVAASLNAAARTLRATRQTQGDVLSLWQGLQRTPRAPPMPAQRVARFAAHWTRHYLVVTNFLSY